MKIKTKLARFFSVGLVGALLHTAPCMRAQSVGTSHSLILKQSVETIDKDGRRVLVANASGDLSGVLTLALVTAPNGVVSAGEWALNVSYLEYGPPNDDADGDASQKLVQRGVIKGLVSSGSVVLNSAGLPIDLSSIQLRITGATLEFASITSGNGSVTGNSMDQHDSSSGTLTISY